MNAQFPESIWNGNSPGHIDHTKHEARPSWEDWEQMTAELQAVQDAVLSGKSGQGTVAVATGLALASTNGLGVVNQTVLTLTGVVLSASHDDVTHGNYTSQELFDLPSNAVILGGSMSLSIVGGSTNLTATAAFVAGVGTAAAAASSGDGTLAATESNVVSSTAMTLVSHANGPTSGNTAVAPIGGHNLKAYLNFQVPTAGSSGTDSVTVTGTVTITWASL